MRINTYWREFGSRDSFQEGPVLSQTTLFKTVITIFKRIRLTFKGQFLRSFFHVKPSIVIVTTASKKTFVKYRNKRDLFTKTYFRTKCELSKSIFPGKHPGS